MFKGRESDATILRSKRENPGFVSSVLRAASAKEIQSASLFTNKTESLE
jgi:hypothetical protein